MATAVMAKMTKQQQGGDGAGDDDEEGNDDKRPLLGGQHKVRILRCNFC
jgi:hypothetical protein